jgi:hypothetical protein
MVEGLYSFFLSLVYQKHLRPPFHTFIHGDLGVCSQNQAVFTKRMP